MYEGGNGVKPEWEGRKDSYVQWEGHRLEFEPYAVPFFTSITVGSETKWVCNFGGQAYLDVPRPLRDVCRENGYTVDLEGIFVYEVMAPKPPPPTERRSRADRKAK